MKTARVRASTAKLCVCNHRSECSLITNVTFPVIHFWLLCVWLRYSVHQFFALCKKSSQFSNVLWQTDLCNILPSHDSAPRCFLHRRKSASRIAELEDLLEQARLKLVKLDKEKVKLQIEIRDLTVEYETVRT